MLRLSLGLTSLIVIGSGCCMRSAHNVVPNPSQITIDNALASVGKGFADMRSAEGDMHTGLLPSEVVVTFNVTAGGKDNTELVLDMNANAAPPTIPVTAGGKLESTATSEATASRSNQIVVKFSNVWFTPEKQFITTRSPADISTIGDYIMTSTPPFAPTPRHDNPAASGMRAPRP